MYFKFKKLFLSLRSYLLEKCDLKANVHLIVAPSLATRRVKEFSKIPIVIVAPYVGSDQSSIFSDAEFDLLLQISHKIHLTMIIQACTWESCFSYRWCIEIFASHTMKLWQKSDIFDHVPFTSLNNSEPIYIIIYWVTTSLKRTMIAAYLTSQRTSFMRFLTILLLYVDAGHMKGFIWLHFFVLFEFILFYSDLLSEHCGGCRTSECHSRTLSYLCVC